VNSFTSWIYTFALGLGGPGLFVIALLDSSFVPLPQINDLLVVFMVTHNKSAVLYYAGMATLGSVAGCYIIYYLAEKGGEAFLHRRLHPARIERALALYRRHGVLALIVPALLPPPTPFKLFVLMAGIAEVRPWKFVLSVAFARGLRYFGLGLLAVRYGDSAMDLMRTRGRDVAIAVVIIILLGAIALWIARSRSATKDTKTV
jgi:membrane protein YqaA with SNARE-associated domain